jgi:hypothetical protein
MTTNELKQYIDRVLGNSIRCLLPSYWWKRLFGLVVDKVEELDGKVAKKADKSQLSNKQNLLISGENIKTIQGESVIGSGNIELPVDSALSDDSYNPVQNSVITKELKKISPIFHITKDSGFIDYLIAMQDTFANGNKSNKYPMAIVGKDQSDAIVDAVVNLGNSNFGIEFNVRDKRYRWVFSIVSGEFIREEEIFLSSNIEETDPIFSSSPAGGIKATDITNWNNKVDKVNGKQLSTEDFTTALKTKLEGLSNYDNTELESAINTLRSDFNKLVSGDTTTAIKTFNEVIAFLDGISDTQDLEGIIASIQQQIAGKQDTLVSGTNIKTINGDSILGSGNIVLGASTEIYVGSNVPTDENITV